jgi:hydrogenase-4 component B
VPLLTMLIPVVAALIALVAALAGYTMVKFFGVIFLGQPREEQAGPGPRRRPVGAWRHALAGGGLPGAGPAAGAVHCQLLDPVTQHCWCGPGLGAACGGQRLAAGAQRPSEQASYGPVIFLLGHPG